PVLGSVQPLVPRARPMKLAVPRGAALGKSTQVRLPMLVSMVATGWSAEPCGVGWAACAIADRASISRQVAINGFRINQVSSGLQAIAIRGWLGNRLLRRFAVRQEN